MNYAVHTRTDQLAPWTKMVQLYSITQGLQYVFRVHGVRDDEPTGVPNPTPTPVLRPVRPTWHYHGDNGSLGWGWETLMTGCYGTLPLHPAGCVWGSVQRTAHMYSVDSGNMSNPYAYVSSWPPLRCWLGELRWRAAFLKMALFLLQHVLRLW